MKILKIHGDLKVLHISYNSQERNVRLNLRVRESELDHLVNARLLPTPTHLHIPNLQSKIRMQVWRNRTLTWVRKLGRHIKAKSIKTHKFRQASLPLRWTSCPLLVEPVLFCVKSDSIISVWRSFSKVEDCFHQNLPLPFLWPPSLQW